MRNTEQRNITKLVLRNRQRIKAMQSKTAISTKAAVTMLLRTLHMARAIPAIKAHESHMAGRFGASEFVLFLTISNNLCLNSYIELPLKCGRPEFAGFPQGLQWCGQPLGFCYKLVRSCSEREMPVPIYPSEVG